MRALLITLCSALLRIFFRRIEVVGLHNIPETGGILFALNHPSGLIDPLFLLCLSGRRVSFLAKAPLFSMPLVGYFVRTFESLPVYRAQDGNDTSQNKAMMGAAVKLLERGNAIAIFPEATSHSDPELKRFRSGAARIALSASAVSEMPVYVIPGALYYEHKQTFRSRAVLAFGAPISASPTASDDSVEPTREEVVELTQRLREAVDSLLPTAESAEGLLLAEKAERVISAAVRDTPERCPLAAKLSALPAQPSFADRMRTRRKILDGYEELIDHAKNEISEIVDDLERLAAELETEGLPVDAAPHQVGHRLQDLLLTWARLVFLLPIAALGTIIHLPAYQAVRFVAFKYSSKDVDVTASVKVVAGLAFFPATWLAVACAGWAWTDSALWWSALVLGPLLAWLTLIFYDASSWWQRYRRLRAGVRSASLDWDQILQKRAGLAEAMASLIASRLREPGENKASPECNPGTVA